MRSELEIGVGKRFVGRRYCCSSWEWTRGWQETWTWYFLSCQADDLSSRYELLGTSVLDQERSHDNQ